MKIKLRTMSAYDLLAYAHSSVLDNVVIVGRELALEPSNRTTVTALNKYERQLAEIARLMTEVVEADKRG